MQSAHDFMNYSKCCVCVFQNLTAEICVNQIIAFNHRVRKFCTTRRRFVVLLVVIFFVVNTATTKSASMIIFDILFSCQGAQATSNSGKL